MDELIEKVEWNGIPVCVDADGLNVCDDTGNVWGYADILEIIHGSDKEEAENMRAWAKGQGWTGRKTKPENML